MILYTFGIKIRKLKGRENKRENQVEEGASLGISSRATARYSRVLRTEWKSPRLIILSLPFEILKSRLLISSEKFSKMDIFFLHQFFKS